MNTTTAFWFVVALAVATATVMLLILGHVATTTLAAG